MSNGDLTPTQRRMMTVLEDGLVHSLKQLHGCLNDELSDNGAVQIHVHNLRRKIARHGKSIIRFSEDGVTYYQLRRKMGRS